jgi:hypothetical protein
MQRAVEPLSGVPAKPLSGVPGDPPKAFSSNSLLTAVVTALVTLAGSWAVTHHFAVQSQAARSTSAST